MFLYELHQHTAACSKCASITPEEVVISVKQRGFSGVVVTNHFYHGNTAVDRNLSWADFCKAYEDDYYAIKTEGEKIGIDVLYGIEEAVDPGKEVLLYGLEPDYIGKFSELKQLDFSHLSEVVRSGGGLVIQAHPFRVRDYIPDPDALLDMTCLDGYEVYNKHNPPEENEKALRLAERTGLIMTAGTDNHSFNGEERFGIAVENRIKTEKDLAKVLVSREYDLFCGHDLCEI